MGTGVVLGRLRHTASGSAVRFELEFPVSVRELWRALTVPDRLARWLAPLDGERRPGATVRLLFGLEVAAEVTIVHCLPERRLDLGYRFPDGLDTRLHVAVGEGGDERARLVLDHQGLPGSPADTAAAWQVALDALGADLAGRPAAADPAAFGELAALYEASWRRLTDA